MSRGRLQRDMISRVQSFGVVGIWRLVIHINHMGWERHLLRVTAVKITRRGWDSLKLTYGIYV